MTPLSLLSSSPIMDTPKFSETTSSLLEWISPLGLLSTSLVAASPQLLEAASKAYFGATC